MAMATLKLKSSPCHFFIIFFTSLLVLTTSNINPPCSLKNHTALFVFGDSLLDAGNNNYLENTLAKGNFPPYGETFFKYPSGRFSDGRVIPDFIAEYGKLPLTLPYLFPGNHQCTDGVNFASGGAGALVDTNQGSVIDLKTQLNYFKKVKKQLRQEIGDAQTKILLTRAIYLFSIGGNDYLSPLTRNSSLFHSYSTEDYVGMVIGNLTTVIKEIYNEGGRKFGYLGIPPLGCIPFVNALYPNSTGGCVENVTAIVKLHAKAVSKVLKELQTELLGFKYSELDAYTTVGDRIDNPSKYGFKEGKVACCGNGPYRGLSGSCGGRGAVKEYELCNDTSKYVFFDAAHPTEAANKQLAELMWSGSDKFTRPYNLKTLFEA